MRIRYKRTTVTINKERIQRCAICGRLGRTEMHHIKYAYKTKEVKKNPELAGDNIVECCFQCHFVGNAIRIIEENPEKTKKFMEIINVLKSLEK